MRSITEEKRKQPQQILADTELCRWCDSRRSPASVKAVCRSCYELLMGANLPDREIFGAQSRRANVFK